MPVLAPTELAYIAGIVDGEGCISITMQERRTRNFERNLYREYSPYIRITNTNLELLNWIKLRFPYSSITSSKRENNNWKIAHRLSILTSDQLDFLEKIEQYLVLKRRQSDILKEFLKVRIHRSLFNIEERKYNLMMEITTLNSRGNK
jgi:hypothetical protein